MGPLMNRLICLVALLGLPLRFGANRGEPALAVQNLGLADLDLDPVFQFQRRVFVALRVGN